MRKISFWAALVTGATLSLRAQAPNPTASLQFDVASIKPTADRTAPGMVVHLPAETGYRGVNSPLMLYLQVAYQVRFDQISGPAWLNTENFDIEAKADRTCTADELHVMLQHLLEDRFHMKFHRETKQAQGYSLVVDKGEPKLTEHDPQDLAMLPIPGGPGTHKAKNVSMQYFTFYLSQQLGETVVDKTGLTGHYDFNLEWDMAPMPERQPGSPETPMPMISIADMNAGVFDAVRKQLGLRLEKGKVAVTQIVIDQIGKLAEN
jgi:uncharacterized protein (TIGR03435 family)